MMISVSDQSIYYGTTGVYDWVYLGLNIDFNKYALCLMKMSYQICNKSRPISIQKLSEHLKINHDFFLEIYYTGLCHVQ